MYEPKKKDKKKVKGMRSIWKRQKPNKKTRKPKDINNKIKKKKKKKKSEIN